jgi:hypothetical protein
MRTAWRRLRLAWNALLGRGAAPHGGGQTTHVYARIFGTIRLCHVTGRMGEMLLCQYEEKTPYGGKSGTCLVRPMDIVPHEEARQLIAEQRAKGESTWKGGTKPFDITPSTSAKAGENDGDGASR